jgi:hypothetical protein
MIVAVTISWYGRLHEKWQKTARELFLDRQAHQFQFEALNDYEIGSGFNQLQHKARQKETPGGISPSGFFVALPPKNVPPPSRASMATTRSLPA